MEPFTNYEEIENVSTIQKIMLYQKAIDNTRENRFTSQPTKESYLKDALSREETSIIKL